MQALVAVDRRARAGLALQVDDRRAVREHLDDQFALRLAALDVVGADMADDARHRRHAPVDGDDRDLGVDRLLQRRRHRVDSFGLEHDALHALGERRLDVGGLLRRGDLAVALDRVEALLGRLGLERLHHVDEERKVHSRARRPGSSACRRRRRARRAPSPCRLAVTIRRVKRMDCPPLSRPDMLAGGAADHVRNRARRQEKIGLEAPPRIRPGTQAAARSRPSAREPCPDNPSMSPPWWRRRGGSRS